MKGIFYFPPNWCHSHPDIGIPAVMPYLQEFDMEVCDLNVQYRIYQRSRENLDKCYERIGSAKSPGLSKKYDMIYRFLIENKVKVECILHDIERFTDLEEYMLTSLYERHLQLFHKTAYEKDDNIDLLRKISDMMEVIDDIEKNYYLDFYISYFKERDLSKTDVILVSLAGTQQMVSSFTLCRYLKKNYPNIRIIVGGPPFSKIIHQIDQNWRILFENIFDYIIIYEEEHTIPALLKRLKEHKDIESVPGCIYMQDGMVIKTAADESSVDITDDHLPDFSGFYLPSYNVPEVVLPYAAAGGYNGKERTLDDPQFECTDDFPIKSMEKVMDDLRVYQQRYGAKYIHFVDKEIPPDVIEEMCHAILEKKLDMKWSIRIKPSRQYTEKLCCLMKRAGAVYVCVEFCPPGVRMAGDKRSGTEDIELTLTNMKKAHIWTHCFLLNDFETEDYKSKWDTFGFVHHHKNIFSSIDMVNDFGNDIEYMGSPALEMQENGILGYLHQINFSSGFFYMRVFEREHLAFWMSEKQEFLNPVFLQREYLNKMMYNKNFLLKKVSDGKLYLYSLITEKFYVLPEQYEDIIEYFDGDTEWLDEWPQTQIPSDKESIVRFLIDELYGSTDVLL